MSEILSLWRSPLDRVAVMEAQALSSRQPRCSSGIELWTNFDVMTIYNLGYYVKQYPPNDTAFARMFSDMQNAGGGAAFIPQNAYTLSSSPQGFAVADQCEVVGSGGGGAGSAPSFYHFKIQGTGGSGNPGNVFLNCAGDFTTGGKYLRSLAFHWESPLSPSDTCIAAGTYNCRVVDCTFTDCPIAFYVTGPSCGLQQCTIEYEQGPGGTTAIVVAGPQCGICGPGELLQTTGAGGGGPAGCSCISVQFGASQTVIADLHISNWNNGIDFFQSAGAQYTDIRNCEMQCYDSAVNITLQSGATAKTFGIKLTSCTLAKSHDAAGPHAVVVIDPSGAPNDLLSDITLVDCTVFSQAKPPEANQHGLEIVGGTNIKVLGGTYSNNGSETSAGIAVTGPCGDVQIIGANLQPSYLNVGSGYINSQKYALLVTANPMGTVVVSDCDMTGYSGVPSPVSVTVAPSNNLFVSSCSGYNDRNTALIASIPQLISGVSAATCSNPYFGPSVLVFSSPSPVTLTVFGQMLTMSFGVIFLPSPYDTVSFSAPPSAVTWTGK